MKRFIGLLTALVAFGATADCLAPFLPEECARFDKIESMTGDVTFTASTGVSSFVEYSDSGDGSFPMRVAMVDIGYATVAASSDKVIYWNIPANAIIKDCWYEVVTTFTSATDAATIGFNVANSSIVDATAISSGTTWDATGAPVQAIPDWATVAHQIKMPGTAYDLLVQRGGGEVLTAGEVILYCVYVEGE